MRPGFDRVAACVKTEGDQNKDKDHDPSSGLVEAVFQFYRRILIVCHGNLSGREGRPSAFASLKSSSLYRPDGIRVSPAKSSAISDPAVSAAARLGEQISAMLEPAPSLRQTKGISVIRCAWERRIDHSE